MKLPWLVQRIAVRSTSDETAKGIDRHFSFDYMGAAEFEFGTLPKALQLMREQEGLSIQRIKIGTSEGFKLCWFVGPDDQYKVAVEFFRKALTRETRTKEPTYIAPTYGMLDRATPDYLKCDGWWALTDTPFVLFTRKEMAKKWLLCL